MVEHPDRPRENDAVLGSQFSTPVSGIILGGIEGVRRRLASASVEQRIAALSEALNYGQEGLDLVIQALQQELGQVRWAAYRLLQQRTESRVDRVLREYNPYQYFECLYTLEGHSQLVNTVAISPDDKILVSGGNDRSITVWDLQTRQIIRTIETRPKESFSIRYDVKSVAISPDGLTFVSADDNGYGAQIKVWNLKTGQEICKLYANDEVDCVAIAPDGQRLAAASTYTYWCELAESRIGRGEILVWDLPTGKQMKTFYSPEEFNAVKSVAIAPDGKTIIAGNGGSDEPIRVWSSQGKPLYTLSEHFGAVKCVAVSRDGKTLVSGSYDQTVKVWHLRRKKLLHTLKGHSSSVNSVAISPDGQVIVSASTDKTIKIWHLPTGRVISTLTEHSSAVNSVVLSHDGQTLFSGSADKTIKVWGIKDRSSNSLQSASVDL